MEEKLQKIIEEAGGIFEFDKLPHKTVKLFFDLVQDKFSFNQEFIKNIYKSNFGSFNVFFINKMEIDASANTFADINGNKVDYILIYAGLPFALLNIFLRILSHPSTFIDIGDCNKEALNEDDTMNIEDIKKKPDQITLFPKCKIREFYAMELAKSALDFIFCHELAHLYRGHFEYKNSNKKNMQLPHPLDVGNKDNNKILLLQAIEFDADLIGMKISWRLMSLLGKRFALLKKECLDSNCYSALFAVYQSPSHAFRVLTISTYTFFRVYAENWNPKTQFFDSKGTKEHPDEVIRMSYILYDFIKSQDPIVENEDISVEWNQTSPFFKNLIISLNQAEEGFALIQGKEINLRPLFSVLQQEKQFNEYLEDILTKRNELILGLIPFMRGSDFNN